MIITLATVNQKPEIKIELTTADIGMLWRDNLITLPMAVPGSKSTYAVFVSSDYKNPVDVAFESQFSATDAPDTDPVTISRTAIYISLEAIVKLLNAGSQRHTIAQSDLTVMLSIKGA